MAGNVLAQDGRVAAILDFEFATLTARALDVAMGLRMAMRTWENPEPWQAVRTFCRSCRHHIRLSADEVSVLPLLIRLRGAITALWWLGRDDPAGT